jgi:hypothetical protein
MNAKVISSSTKKEAAFCSQSIASTEEQCSTHKGRFGGTRDKAKCWKCNPALLESIKCFDCNNLGHLNKRFKKCPKYEVPPYPTPV